MNVIDNNTGDLVAIESTHARQAARMLAEAQAFEIDCQELAEVCAEELRGVKATLNAIEEQRKDMKAPALETCRRIDAMFNKLKEGYLAAESAYKKALGAWQDKERIRLDAERKAAEEAQRKARELLERQQKELAEKLAAERAEAERQAREAQAAGDAEAAARAAAAAAVKAAEVAAQAQAAELESLALSTLPPVAATVTKLAGVSDRQNWKAEVVDLMALVKAVAAGHASLELLEANTKEINKRAKALKTEFMVPGVRVYAETTVAVRAK